MRIFLATILLIIGHAAATAQVVTFDEDYFPYPWGAECPFPWDRVVENDWQIQMGQNLTSAHFTTTKIGPDFVVVRLDISDRQGNLLASGSGIYNSSRTKVVGLQMIGSDTVADFFVLLRLYPEKGFLPPSGEVVDPRIQSQICGSKEKSVLALTMGSLCTAQGCKGGHQLLSPKVDNHQCDE